MPKTCSLHSPLRFHRIAPLLLLILMTHTPLRADPEVAHAGAECAAMTLEGSWGFSCTGVITGIGPFSQVALSRVDRMGRMSGNDTLVTNGGVVRRSLSGIVRLQRDCSTTATITTSDGFSGDFDGVLVDQGKELRFVQSAPAQPFLCSARRTR